MVRSELMDVVAQRWSLPVNRPVRESALFVNGRLLAAPAVSWPDGPAVGVRGEDIVFVRADQTLAAELTADVWLDPDRVNTVLQRHQDRHPRRPIDLPRYGMIGWPWHLVRANGPEMVRQWESSGGPAVEGTIYPGAHLINERAIRIGVGSKIKPCAVLDAEEGPIVIGRNVTVNPQCTIQGPCFIGDGSLIQPGAVVREGTAIGPVCKVGGEIDNSILHAYSNKQHDGFLGHSYLGEWINIAADCINSDLKNTYGEVSVPINGVETPTGEMFVGLTMGDHSKAGINLSFATGSVVGFACNIFVSRYPPKFVPSFSWYTDEGRDAYDAHRGIEVARKVMARRKVRMTAAEERLFLALPDIAHRHERTDGQACICSSIAVLGFSLVVNIHAFGFRYFLPLVGFLVILLSIHFGRLLGLAGRARATGIVVLAVLVACGTLSLVEFGDLAFYGVPAGSAVCEPLALKGLVEALLSEGIHHIYTADPMLHWSLMFASQEHIIGRWITPNDRYPEYPRRVDRALADGKKIAVVGGVESSEISVGLQVVEKSLKELGRGDLRPRVIMDAYWILPHPDASLLRKFGFILNPTPPL